MEKCLIRIAEGARQTLRHIRFLARRETEAGAAMTQPAVFIFLPFPRVCMCICDASAQRRAGISLRQQANCVIALFSAC